MPEQTSTLTTEYGGETMEAKELQLKLKDNLVITYLDEEGLVFEADTRRTFWVNETGAFLLKLLEANHEGVILQSARKLLQQQYIINGGSKMEEDLDVFVSCLRRFGLVSLRSVSDGTNSQNLNNGPSRPYVRPMIEEETGTLSITGAQVRAAHMAASRSAAAGRASAAGFRGFR